MAANWIFAEVEKTLANGQSVGVETVMSTRKYLPLFHQIADIGASKLIYIGNRSADISVERVRLRVAEGGHDVPEDKIRNRWEKSLKNLPDFWDAATQAHLYDYSAEYPIRTEQYSNRLLRALQFSQVIKRHRNSRDDKRPAKYQGAKE